MNTSSNQDRISDFIEQCLTVIAALIIAAAPVYSLCAMNTVALVSPI